MDMSVFDLFKIGIGPSSSHTVGPMVAARRFLVEYGPLDQVVGVEVALYGSLALTGVGHATDKAVILGLMGETPQDVAPDAVDSKLAAIEAAGEIALLDVPAKCGEPELALALADAVAAALPGAAAISPRSEPLRE